MAGDPDSVTTLLSLLRLNDLDGVRCSVQTARRLRIDIGAGPQITLYLWDGDADRPAWFRGEQLGLAYGRPGGADPLADPVRGRILRAIRRRVEAEQEAIAQIIAALEPVAAVAPPAPAAPAPPPPARSAPASGDGPKDAPHRSLCVLPYNSLHVAVDGTISTCCLVTTPLAHPDGRPFRLGQDRLAEVWQSEDLARFRRAFAAGERPAICERCWQTEAAGGHSKRLSGWRKFPEAARYVEADEPRLEALDLNLCNLCNLACRTCGPEDSSAWATEAAHQARALAAGDEPVVDPAPGAAAHASWCEDPGIWEGIDTLLGQLRYVELLGGEPFLIKAQFDFLERCVEQGEAEHITLGYCTNATLVPARGVELWPHFAAVKIGLSIDAVGRRFEYLRHPAKWPKVLEVLGELESLSCVELDCRVTASLYNILYLPELHDWATAAGLPYRVMPCIPSCFSVDVLPSAAKRAVRQRLQEHALSVHGDAVSDVRALLDIMDARDGWGEHFETFRRLTTLGDAYRGESFEQTFPELCALLPWRS